MRIEMAHLRDQGIDFAVFAADAPSRSNTDRRALLSRLTSVARYNGLRVEKAALAYEEFGRPTFFGAPDLVNYLVSAGGVPRWTHSIEA